MNTQLQKLQALGNQHQNAEWRKLFVRPKLPEKLQKLQELAMNLWTFWNDDAKHLFAEVSPEHWDTYKNNPVAILEAVSSKRLNALAEDQNFMSRLNETARRFDDYMGDRKDPQGPRIAYFCMEYGLDALIKLYSGGLGILAGDYLKEASDSKVNMTAVGLLYRNGYFKQTLNEHGEQIAIYNPQKFSYLPLSPVKDENDEWVMVEIDMPGYVLHAKTWKIQVGSVSLYLLDADVSENAPEHRNLTSELYGGDREHRLKQEVLLGIGGMRLLEKMDINADLFHLNEGHAAFTGIERLRNLVERKGLEFKQAAEVVRASSLFTTHTPVPAGHDAFTEEEMGRYFSHYPALLNINWREFISLGRSDGSNHDEMFSMSFLASRLSQEINGVSRLHGDVSKDIFKPLYKGYLHDEVPIGYVTNGAHFPTHTSKDILDLLTSKAGAEFFHHKTDPEDWDWVNDIDDRELWNCRKKLKKQFMVFLKEYMEQNLTQQHQSPKYIVSALSRISEDALVIGFARRFATYKRASLIFSDLDQLREIVNNPERPVIFVFAGKAHPKDQPGQALIKRVVEVSRMPEFVGKVIFLEDYNMYVARHLVSGCDVWLNNPTRPLEASGTSGIKACFNGVLNLSVLDGWWAEGYMEGTGWALDQERTYDYQEFQDQLDAATIYNLLRDEVVPSFFEREDDLPVDWIKRVKKTLQHVVPRFTMTRMIDDYKERFYSKLYERQTATDKDNFDLARRIADWKERVLDGWEHVEVLDMEVFDSSNQALEAGDNFKAKITIDPKDLAPEDIGLEIIFLYSRKDEDEDERANSYEMKLAQSEEGRSVYEVSVPIDHSGVFNYGFRMFPKSDLLARRHELPLVRWI